MGDGDYGTLLGHLMRTGCTPRSATLLPSRRRTRTTVRSSPSASRRRENSPSNMLGAIRTEFQWGNLNDDCRNTQLVFIPVKLITDRICVNLRKPPSSTGPTTSVRFPLVTSLKANA